MKEKSLVIVEQAKTVGSWIYPYLPINYARNRPGYGRESQFLGCAPLTGN
jgi:hypothetical protein